MASNEKGLRLYSQDGDVIAELFSCRRDSDKLVINGKILGAMRMDMILTPRGIFESLRMVLCWEVISFVLLLPYFGLRQLLHVFHKK